MTREERFKMDMIDEFKQMCEIVEKDGRIIENKRRMLKALSQEPICPSHGIDCEDCPAYDPCGDAISREDALMALTGEWTEITDEIIHRFIKRIKALPSVNPQPKTAHWIDREVYDSDRWKCSECGRTEPYKENYCPNCGRCMVEPQESEVQDA